MLDGTLFPLNGRRGTLEASLPVYLNRHSIHLEGLIINTL